MLEQTYTIDLVNGDIVGYFDWNDNEGLGLNLWYLEENRKRRFPTMRIFKSYVGTFISRYYEQEIIIYSRRLRKYFKRKTNSLM